MWLLHQRHDHAGRRVPRDDKTADRRPGPTGPGGKPVQMRYPCPYPSRRDAGSGENGVTAQAPNTLLSRRAFLAQGGALVVTFALTSQRALSQTARPTDK